MILADAVFLGSRGLYFKVSANLYRRPQILLTALVIGLLCFAGILQHASAAAGDDPVHPLTPTDSWMTLANGAQQWYAFREEGDGTPITIRMTVLPVRGATFTVLTTADVKLWARGETLSAVGAGSQVAPFPHDLYWTGSFIQSGTYYVLVRSNGQGTSNYKLTISGSGVSFPLLSFSQPASPLATPPGPYPIDNGLPRVPSAQITPDPQPSSSPENPLPPIGKAMSIAVGETQWYAFRDEGDEAGIRVSADTTPDACLTFEVWTPEQLHLWQLGQEFRPVGQGTANPVLRADLFWSGSFVKAGIYYVVVKRNPGMTEDCIYELRVMGDDVSLLQPNTER